jgi:hypothetical protein
MKDLPERRKDLLATYDSISFLFSCPFVTRELSLVYNSSSNQSKSLPVLMSVLHRIFPICPPPLTCAISTLSEPFSLN